MALIDFHSQKVKQRINFVYGMGAAVVIMGATFKILHLPGGDIVIGVGMIVEALLFVVSAFEPVHAEYDWEKVYPELTEGAEAKGEVRKVEAQDPEALLSEKLDKLMKDAQLDARTMNSLSEGFKKFGQAAEQLNATTDASASTQKYGEQLAMAANHMESLNALYSVQIEGTSKHVDINKAVLDNLTNTVEDSRKLHKEVQSLADNLSSLNNVYGGMLSAMNNYAR